MGRKRPSHCYPYRILPEPYGFRPQNLRENGIKTSPVTAVCAADYD